MAVITGDVTAVLILKTPHGGLRSETATWIKIGTVLKIRLNSWTWKALGIIVFQGGEGGRGYRNMRKIAGGSKWDLL